MPLGFVTTEVLSNVHRNIYIYIWMLPGWFLSYENKFKFLDEDEEKEE